MNNKESMNNLNYPHQFDSLFYPSDGAYYKTLERERKKQERERKKTEWENLPSLIYNYQLPFYADYVEAYSLFHFMITGKPKQTHYLNPRHKWLHHAIKEMYETGWAYNMGTKQLIHYLHEYDLIDRVGGEVYVKKLFNDLDVQSVLYHREY